MRSRVEAHAGPYLARPIVLAAVALFALLGLLLVLTPGVVDWSQGWPWVKAGSVIAMSALHGMLSRYRKDFAADANVRPAKFYRAINEVPTVLMIVIVIMVIVKPF